MRGLKRATKELDQRDPAGQPVEMMLQLESVVGYPNGGRDRDN
jgi:hypothetical protein